VPASRAAATGFFATALGAPASALAAAAGALAFAPRYAAPPPPDPPKGSPLKATKVASERKTTRTPQVSAVVAPTPAR
jgi:hypothetical protein